MNLEKVVLDSYLLSFLIVNYLIKLMDSKSKKQDYFSSFVNWFSALGNDQPSTEKVNGGQDFFSKLMNRISG